MPPSNSACLATDCAGVVTAHGLCWKHYRQQPKDGKTRARELRFWAKVRTAGVDECWLWVPAVRSNGGYSRFRRFAYREFVGPIPEGLFVLHSCECPPCVNPRHLFLSTRNVQDPQTVIVAVRMRPEDATAVHAEAQRSGLPLSTLLLIGAGLPSGGAATRARPDNQD